MVIHNIIDPTCAGDAYPGFATSTMATRDRMIFFIGCPLVILATSGLIASAIKFKKLRKQPGDIVVGIALSDFALAFHWLSMAIYPEGVNSQEFCVNTGSVGTFAGTTEFLYNMAFNFYLLVSLKNALKQDKIPKKSIHFGAIGTSLIILLWFYFTDRIGKTFVMTCSIKSRCGFKFFNYIWPPALAASYLALAVYTYIYITKNAPKCAKVHAERAAFLIYYKNYIMATIVIYSFIALFNVISPVLNLTVENQNDPFEATLNSLYNITRVASPLVLSIIRFRDPLIFKLMKKTFFPKKEVNPSRSLGISLINADQQPNQTITHAELTIKDSVPNPNTSGDDDDDGEGEFNFNKLQTNLKTQITYTLLSCVLYGDNAQKANNNEKSEIVADTKSKNPYKHQRILQINDDIIKKELPEVVPELNENSVTIMQGTLKAYAPEIFAQYLSEDKDYFNLHTSLDLKENAGEISDASGPGGGRSGEFFFFSKDKKLIVKTIPDPEMKALISILDKYDEHFKANENSLIAKIYGAFTFASAEYGQNFNLIIMKNLNGLPSSYVRRCYDMKGSRYERQVVKDPIKSKEDLKQYGVMKDLDFENHEKKLYIDDSLKADLVRQIEIDSTFFRRAKLMDYSFMVFCINKKQYEEDNGALDDSFTAKNRLGSLENKEEPGMIYKIGIVDYLQPYNFQKRFEKLLKKVKKLDAKLETSTQDPAYYSQRFIAFMAALIEMPAKK